MQGKMRNLRDQLRLLRFNVYLLQILLRKRLFSLLRSHFLPKSGRAFVWLRSLSWLSKRLCLHCWKQVRMWDLCRTLLLPPSVCTRIGSTFAEEYCQIDELDRNETRIGTLRCLQLCPQCSMQQGSFTTCGFVNELSRYNLQLTIGCRLAITVKAITPPTASVVKVALVKCPRYADDVATDTAALTAFFTTKLLLAEGNLFFVKRSPSENICFKINRPTLTVTLVQPTELASWPINDKRRLMQIIVTQIESPASFFAIHNQSEDGEKLRMTWSDAEKGSNCALMFAGGENQFYRIVNISKTERTAEVVKLIAAADSTKTHGPMLVSSACSTLFQVTSVCSSAPQCCFDNAVEMADDFWRSATTPVVFGPYLDRLAAAFHSPTANRAVLLTGQSGSGKRFLVGALSRRLNIHQLCVDAYQLWSEVPASGEARLRNAFDKAQKNTPCVFYIRNIEVLGKDVQTDEIDSRIIACYQHCVSELPSNVLLVCGTQTCQAAQLDITLASSFLQEIHIKNLTEMERCELLVALTAHYYCRNSGGERINFSKVSQKTAGFALADLKNLVVDTVGKCKRGTLSLAHFNDALEMMHKTFSDSIGAPKVPDVRWDDVGGLQEAKQAILDTVQLALDHPDLFADGLRRSGVLLYGPPGCGKTLLAKAVASECELTFLSVKGPELLNMYVGQSEQNIRDVFERARQASPCVLFFDELDSLAPNRGRSGDSGGVMDRVVSQLLAELDGVDGGLNTQLFVIGATNRPDLIDPSLLRPGRFDKLVYVGIGDGIGSRVKILQAVTRKLTLAVDVDLPLLAERCPSGMSGADFYALGAQATSTALKRIGMMIEANQMTEEEADLTVTMADFLCALPTLKPSVDSSQLSVFALKDVM